MTVAEFIATLQRLDQTMLVMVQGYEGGLCDVDPKRITMAKVVLDHNNSAWEGPHERVDSACDAHGHPLTDRAETAMALVLGRGR